MLKAVILDFDGVLVESNEVKTAVFADLFNDYPDHRQVMMAYHIAHQSLPRREKFRYFATTMIGAPPGSPEAKAVVERMAVQFTALVVHRIVNCPEVPGAAEFLEYFHSRCLIFMASNTPQEELSQILAQRGMAHYFNKVYGNPPVPKTDAIRKLMVDYRLEPDELVFVGDAPSDYNAALSAGIRFVGRDSGLFRHVDFPLFGDMLEILAYLRPMLDNEADLEIRGNLEWMINPKF